MSLRVASYADSLGMDSTVFCKRETNFIFCLISFVFRLQQTVSKANCVTQPLGMQPFAHIAIAVAHVPDVYMTITVSNRAYI